MKKISLFILSIFLLSFISCKSTFELVSYPQTNGGLLNFIRFEKTANKNIKFFICDLSIYSNKNELYADSIFNYSLTIKGHTKKQLENLTIKILCNNEIISTYNPETLYAEMYKKEILIRKSTSISTVDTEKLLNTDSNIQILIFEEETQIYNFELDDSLEKLSKANLIIS